MSAAETSAPAVAIDLDGALGDTRALWAAFLADAARRFRSIAELPLDELPDDRAEAAAVLDRWAEGGVGDWRTQLERFAEDHAPVHLRPNATSGQIVRALGRAGVTIGVHTDAPAELAAVALSHLGVAGRVGVLEAGSDARERLLAALGPGARAAGTPGELEDAAVALLGG